MITIKIDSTAAVAHADKLTKISRGALPTAIRNTLNSAAFNVKKDTMPKGAKKAFVNRAPNFFKAFSRVEMAKGFNIDNMKSTVGFNSKMKRENDFAVDELQQQEHGGKIHSRTFIPTTNARGGNHKKLVKPSNRLSKINNIISVNNASGKNQGQKFIKSVIHAGKGGYVLTENNGSGMLWRVNSIRKSKYNKFKLTALYSFKKKRTVKIDETEFMEKASLKSAGRLNNYFYIAAQKEIAKIR